MWKLESTIKLVGINSTIGYTNLVIRFSVQDGNHNSSRHSILHVDCHGFVFVGFVFVSFFVTISNKHTKQAHNCKKKKKKVGGGSHTYTHPSKDILVIKKSTHTNTQFFLFNWSVAATPAPAAATTVSCCFRMYLSSSTSWVVGWEDFVPFFFLFFPTLWIH